MPLINDLAIILRRLDYSESSQVLAVFTRGHGKVRVIAKGVRRSSKARFNPGIDLLEVGQLVISVRHVGQEALAVLTEWKQTSAFFGLRERLPRLQAAHYSVDALASLIEDWDPHPALYDGFHHMLKSVSDLDNVLPAVVAFQRTLLDQTGVLPCLEACVGCGRSPAAAGDIYFSSHEGGLLCRDCEPARVEKRLVVASRSALAGAPLESDADVAGMFDLFNYHISHLMGRAPVTTEYFVRLAAQATMPRPS